MQISRTSRNGSAEVAAKTCAMMPRAKRAASKVAGADQSNNTSPVKPSKLPNERSLKTEFRAAKTMEIEKRRPSRVAELECQIMELQEELRVTRDRLSSTESRRRRAQQEAEEAKKQLLVASLKLEDFQNQMAELSATEEARIQELRKISQERDRVWQSELEAVQKQQSVDSAALSAAMSETRRLRLQLEMALRSESAHAKQAETDQLEIQSSKNDLAEASFAIENLKIQLRSSQRAEAEAKSTLMDTRKQLAVAQSTIESLLTDGSRLMESFSIVATELKESRLRVKALEEHHAPKSQALLELGDSKKLRFGSSVSELEELMSALEDSWIMHQEGQIEIIVMSQCCYEMMERMKAESESMAKVSEENERLKLQRENLEAERQKASEAEEKALIKLGFVSEEAEKSSKLAARVAEELTTNQAKKDEVEAELRKLNVQAEQWKKAAETAIVMLTESDQGRIGLGKMESLAFCDESDDESSRKKRSYVVRRIRGMWNKEQK